MTKNHANNPMIYIHSHTLEKANSGPVERINATIPFPWSKCGINEREKISALNGTKIAIIPIPYSHLSSNIIAKL